MSACAYRMFIYCCVNVTVCNVGRGKRSENRFTGNERFKELIRDMEKVPHTHKLAQ